MYTISMETNTNILAKHADNILLAYKQEKRQRIAFLSILAPLAKELFNEGNDRGGTVQLITDLLRQVKPKLNPPSVGEYCLAARFVAEVEEGNYITQGYTTASDIPAKPYHIIAHLGKNVRELAQLNFAAPNATFASVDTKNLWAPKVRLIGLRAEIAAIIKMYPELGEAYK